MSAESPGSVLQLLKNDHKRILGLFRQLEALLAGRSREMLPGVAAELWTELEIHSRIEQELVYPALLNLPPGTGDYAAAWDRMEQIRELVVGAQQKHGELDRRVKRIREIRPDLGEFSVPFTELREELELHLKEEEEDLFPLIDGLSPALGALGERVLARRKELLESPAFREFSAEKVQNPNGGEQKRKTG
ncbi:MAG TPA: hemerythrin domain-containing protein [Bdellovibrionota bacterium]|nr:hemerythrin domain-containing protein [Bdellovibrionota bacterium]